MAEEEKGFVVKDKRAFSPETGGAQPEQEPEVQEESPSETAEGGTGAPASTDDAEGEAFPLPEVNFPTFVFSLSSSALFHFGEVPDPNTGATEKNLSMAKHTIDILGMLEEKTKGNLTGDEEQLLKNILYDLRMRYVKETT